MGICAGYSPSPVGKEHVVKILRDRGCDSNGKRRMFWGGERFDARCWRPLVHSSCRCNEYTSLVMRTMGEYPKPKDLKPLRREFTRLRALAVDVGPDELSHRETALLYSGALRRRYLEAAESLQGDPICKADATLKPFLKAEKLNPNKCGKPRMIMPRSARYNLSLAACLKRFEHELWSRWKVDGCKGRLVAKGLNLKERAKLIGKKFSSIEGCVVVEVDGAQFEAHLTPELLRLEHSVYTSRYPQLKRLLSWQLVLKGVTNHDVKFRREGARASGDFNTGMGNTICMGTSVLATVRSFGARRGEFDLLLDGDNALLFLKPDLYDRIKDTFAARCCDLSGIECTVENPVRLMEHITFGQAKPVWDGVGYTMVRDVWKVLSNSLSTYKYHELEFRRRLWKGVAQCEIAANRGVPVLQSYFSKVLRYYSGQRDVRDDVLGDYKQLLGTGYDRSGVTREPSLRTRASFELAFGISSLEQRRLELLPFVECVGDVITPYEWHAADVDPGLQADV